MAKCPKCNASLEEGVLLCGNCKQKIVWKHGNPSVPLDQKIGAFAKMLILIPVFLFILVPLAVVLFTFAYNLIKAAVGI